jgi:hypothetical protein
MFALGFYRGTNSAQADRLGTDEAQRVVDGQRTGTEAPYQSHFDGPGLDKGSTGVLLPATIYKRPGNPSADAVAMLDGTPVPRPASQTSGSRSPRFREHIADMEDTSLARTPPQRSETIRSTRSPETDSPTLGRDSNLSLRGAATPLADQIRRRQHLMSWNAYDPRAATEGSTDGDQAMATIGPKTPPTARSPDKVSPDTSNSPRDPAFVVSPFGSLDRGQRS